MPTLNVESLIGTLMPGRDIQVGDLIAREGGRWSSPITKFATWPPGSFAEAVYGADTRVPYCGETPMGQVGPIPDDEMYLVHRPSAADAKAV